jgi:hypothetical protein
MALGAVARIRETNCSAQVQSGGSMRLRRGGCSTQQPGHVGRNYIRMAAHDKGLR